MSKNTTEEQVDQAIEEMAADLRVNPDPEAIAKLREEYGVTFDITGQLVEIRQPKRFRKAVQAELEAQTEESDTKGHKLAQSITTGASKTGEVLAYALLDAPIEGAKTVKVVTGSAARNAKEKFSDAHQRRLANAAKRREERKVRKAARAEAKTEQESQDS